MNPAALNLTPYQISRRTAPSSTAASPFVVKNAVRKVSFPGGGGRVGRLPL
jgi:hypothetical protein